MDYPAKRLYQQPKTLNQNNLNAMRLYHLSKRNLVTAYEYSGMTQVANQNLSAVNGLLATQFMLNLYQFAQMNVTKGEKIPHYQQLLLELFHYQETLRDTQLKTKPAYSLDPVLIAKIVGFLSGDLDSNTALTPIIEEWKSKHKTHTGKSYPTKIQHFLDICIQAKKESLSTELSFLPEVILLNFLHYKAKDREDLMRYTLELNKQISFPEIGLLSAKKNFDEEDIREGKGMFYELIRNPGLIDPKDFEWILQLKMEQIIAYQFCKKLERPSEVLQGNYVHHHLSGIHAPSCFETAFHNLFNILLFDRNTQGFNLSLLPEKLKVEKRFKDFYARQTIYNLHSPEMGRDFMNILADNDDFYYVSSDRQFELETDPRNFIQVMRYLLGTPITSLDHLSEVLSTDQRKIKFSELQTNINFYIKIVIEELSEGEKFKIKEDMKLLISPHHAYLHANYSTSQKDSLRDKMSLKSIASKIKNPMQLSLMFANASESFLSDMNVDSIESLRQYFILFPFQTSENALRFCQEALAFSDLHPKEIRQYFSCAYQTFFSDASDAIRFMMGTLSYVESKESLEFLRDFFIETLGEKFSEETMKNWMHLKNDIGNTMLYGVKNFKTAKVLIEAGADVNVKNYRKKSPLHFVTNPDIAKVFIENGANVNAQDIYGETALHVVKNKQIAEMLIAHQAMVNTLNMDAETPLHLARDLDIVKVLIEAGASVNAVTKKGWTPLYYAATGAIARLLIATGAAVNISSNIERKSPLHLAVDFQNKEVVKVLIQEGADMNAQDSEGRSPLHYALTSEMTDILLTAAADPTIRDNHGRTHRDYFPEFYCKAVEDYLDENSFYTLCLG